MNYTWYCGTLIDIKQKTFELGQFELGHVSKRISQLSTDRLSYIIIETGQVVRFVSIFCPNSTSLEYLIKLVFYKETYKGHAFYWYDFCLYVSLQNVPEITWSIYDQIESLKKFN